MVTYQESSLYASYNRTQWCLDMAPPRLRRLPSTTCGRVHLAVDLALSGLCTDLRVRLQETAAVLSVMENLCHAYAKALYESFGLPNPLLTVL